MMRPSPLILPYAGTRPDVAGAFAHAGEDSALLGRVRLGGNAWLGPLSVIRADGHYVDIGDDFHLGPRATVHIAHDVYPTIIGDRVSVGVNACVHACTVGSDVIVEDGSVILDGSIVEDEVVLEPGTFAFPRARLQRGHLYSGAPAKPVRTLQRGEIAERREAMRERHANGFDMDLGPSSGPRRLDATSFVASTARVRGALVMAPMSSIFFSNQLNAGPGTISIGANSNVQDNTIIRCADTGVSIGRDTTVGHNVYLEDCTIGNESLIGIGSFVARGTVVEDHVLLAAGARTEPGQVLESGWLYAKAPAQKLAPLDAPKREMIKFIIWTYCQYNRDFRATETARA